MNPLTTQTNSTPNPVQSEARFRRFFEHFNDALLIIDPATDEILDANLQACRLLDYRREALLATPVPALHPEERPVLTHFFQSVLTKGSGWTDKLSYLSRTGKKLPVELSASTLTVDNQPYLLIQVQARDPSERTSIAHALRSIVEGTATATGTAFFRALVKELAVTLEVRYALVAEFLDNKTRARTLAFWNSDTFGANFEYNLAGTPCEVVAAGQSVYHDRKVYELFPQDPDLAELGVESYFGVPLCAETGDGLGHLAVFHDRPLEAFRGMAILNLFAARARAELERQRAEEQTRRWSEERLSSIIESALDAILTVNQAGHITLFNRAAERIFRCAAGEALGQSCQRFLSQGLQRVLAEYMNGWHPQQPLPAPLWVPEGQRAVRADGELFPIEASLSCAQARDQAIYTLILRDLEERQKAEAELRQLRDLTHYLEQALAQDGEELIGASAGLREVLQQVRQVAPTAATVLISGETGTGKDLIAQALHRLSPRQGNPLIKLNCAALPASLIESELFGHEKGAFTGALTRKPGRFELADGGTLFLDEIGELPLDLQAKLLRVLQEGEFERLGGTRTLKVDVRILAASNRDLGPRARDGQFRADLYYRLNVFPIALPPLRERTEDILPLTAHFVHRYAAKYGKRIDTVPEAALAALQHYRWPGNVRELQHILERAVILTQGTQLALGDWFREAGTGAAAAPVATLEAVERAHILKVLEDTGWRISGQGGAAQCLGLKPTTLESRLKRLGITRKL